MKRSFIIIAAVILLICLSGCQALEMNKAVNEAADHQVLVSCASDLATAINANNALHPEDALPDDATFEKVKETLEKNSLWPQCFHSEQDARKAWEFVVIKNGEAKVPEEDN